MIKYPSIIWADIVSYINDTKLQNPPNVLYKIFPPDSLARVKVQLQVLQDLLKMQTNYTVMEANNGRFWKIPVSA